MKGGVVGCLAGVLAFSFAVLASQTQSSLSGDWSVSVSIDPAVPFTLDFTTSLDLTYEVGDWSFSSDTKFGTNGWTGQDFEIDADLGVIDLSSSVGFNPASGTFKRWSNDLELELEDLSLSIGFDVAPNYVSLDLSGGGELDDVSLDLDIGFRSRGGCSLLFESLDVTVDFPLFCEYDVSAEIGVEDDGFDELVFDISGIDLPGIPWLEYGMEIAFEVDAKTVKMRPSFNFGDPACVDVYIEVQTPTHNTFTSMTVYGFKFQAELGAVEFEGISYLDGTHKLNGKYWEMYSLSINKDGCCGSASADLKVYFLEGGIGLFDIGLFEAAFSLALGESISIDTGFTWDIEAGVFEGIALGFAVSW
ncbi:hypothetical protein ACFLTM_04895 [Candidatus Bipolaricaulota bacterium]